MVDSLHFKYHCTHSLCQASPKSAVMSCCLHACLSINLSACLFSACLSLCLTAYLSLHPSEFVHASLIRHHLCISLPLCSDAVIPILDLLKEALALSCFLYLQLHPSCIQISIQHTAHTADNTPIGLCWCTTFTQSLCCLYPFIHLQSQLVPRCSCLHLILFSTGFLQRFYDSTGGYA